MSVHYKFRTSLEHDIIEFDGLVISVKDLKSAIFQKKRAGENRNFDLQITNAETKEVYEDEYKLIRKNSSLIVARIPLPESQRKSKPLKEIKMNYPTKDKANPLCKPIDLTKLDTSEDDKIKSMMSQSTQDYDPSKYLNVRGSGQVGPVPLSYRCFKCHQSGHWIKDCTFLQGSDSVRIKKSTGIPKDFLVPVDGPQIAGAVLTPNGNFAVPIIDLEAYNEKERPALVLDIKPDVPEEFRCSICSDRFNDAVTIPCCGNTFCDECIRNYLLDSEDQECPDCHKKGIAPNKLIPNRFVRSRIAKLNSTLDYKVRKPIVNKKSQEDVQIVPVVEILDIKKEEIVGTTTVHHIKQEEFVGTNTAHDIKKEEFVGTNTAQEDTNESYSSEDKSNHCTEDRLHHPSEDRNCHSTEDRKLHSTEDMKFVKARQDTSYYYNNLDSKSYSSNHNEEWWNRQETGYYIPYEYTQAESQYRFEHDPSYGTFMNVLPYQILLPMTQEQFQYIYPVVDRYDASSLPSVYEQPSRSSRSKENISQEKYKIQYRHSNRSERRNYLDVLENARRGKIEKRHQNVRERTVTRVV